MRKRRRVCSRCGCTNHNQTTRRYDEKTVVIEVCAQCERIYRRVFWKHHRPQTPAESKHRTMGYVIYLWTPLVAIALTA